MGPFNAKNELVVAVFQNITFLTLPHRKCVGLARLCHHTEHRDISIILFLTRSI